MRSLDAIRRAATDDSNMPTHTSVEQRSVETSCLRLYERFHRNFAAAAAAAAGGHDDGSVSAAPNAANSSDARHPDNATVAQQECIVDNTVDTVQEEPPQLLQQPRLQRERTLNFLRKGLKNLSAGYECLDASRPWLVYWIVHSLELLGAWPVVAAEQRDDIVRFLATCQNDAGGFGGGPGQISHLAPTYAAVNALAIVGGDDALKIIDRTKLVKWMNGLRLADGSFLMHSDGEVDIRGAYCALSVARLTNIYSEQLFRNTANWIVRCQTFEGGFGGAPGMEAHGGYSFCGLAAICLLGKQKLCHLQSLVRWTANRQMRLEGGFQGRTNKLVDGCYSFWQGAVFPLIDRLLSDDRPISAASALPSADRWLFDQESLQEYLLVCCQDPRGGLVDKPGRSRDFYHTCYALSGLSMAQHSGKSRPRVIGSADNELSPTHPLYNIGVTAASQAKEFFQKLPVPIPQIEL